MTSHIVGIIQAPIDNLSLIRKLGNHSRDIKSCDTCRSLASLIPTNPYLVEHRSTPNDLLTSKGCLNSNRHDQCGLTPTAPRAEPVKSLRLTPYYSLTFVR